MGAYFLVVVHGLLIVVASLIAEHQLKGTRASVAAAHGLSSCSFWALEHGLNTCGVQAYLLHGMWDLPGPGIEPVSLHWKANSLPLSHRETLGCLLRKVLWTETRWRGHSRRGKKCEPGHRGWHAQVTGGEGEIACMG